MHHARPRSAHHAARVLRLGGGKRRFRGLELRLEVDELEPGNVPLMISVRLASSSVRFCVTTACACAT